MRISRYPDAGRRLDVIAADPSGDRRPPRGPHGLLAAEVVLGRTVLGHLLDLAVELAPDGEPVAVHARRGASRARASWSAIGARSRLVFMTGPPRADAAVLRTDRFTTGRGSVAGCSRGRIAGIGRALAARPARIAPLGRRGADPAADLSAARQVLGLPPGRAAGRAAPPDADPAQRGDVGVGRSDAGSRPGSSPSGSAARPRPSAIAAAMALALVLDTADGRLARLQGTSSAFGRWLDEFLDELADLALHAAIAWAAFARDGRPLWLLLGIAYASGKYLFRVQSSLGDELEASGQCRAGPVGSRPAIASASPRSCAVTRACRRSLASLDRPGGRAAGSTWRWRPTRSTSRPGPWPAAIRKGGRHA